MGYIWKVYTQLTIYSCTNVSTTLLCGKVVKTLAHFCCCNIFQESFKNVATTLPQNVVRKHLRNIMATFIHVAKCYDIHNIVATFLQYGNIRVDHIGTCIRNKLTE